MDARQADNSNSAFLKKASAIQVLFGDLYGSKNEFSHDVCLHIGLYQTQKVH